MLVESPSLFAQVIQDHLELKRRNSDLEPAMPIGRYKNEDPFDNHPLFKSEEQARLEETMDGDLRVDELELQPTMVQNWPTHEEAPSERTSESGEDGLWSRSRDFDWGD